MTGQELLESIDQMIEQAPSVGLCALPFRILRKEVSELVTECNQLRAYREPKDVLSYKLYAGKCPSCGVVFLDDKTQFCGNCGQRIVFNGDKHGSD